MIKTNNILITGGAGYIGSHIVEQLVKTKSKIIILDNLITGYNISFVINGFFAVLYYS